MLNLSSYCQYLIDFCRRRTLRVEPVVRSEEEATPRGCWRVLATGEAAPTRDGVDGIKRGMDKILKGARDIGCNRK